MPKEGLQAPRRSLLPAEGGSAAATYPLADDHQARAIGRDGIGSMKMNERINRDL